MLAAVDISLAVLRASWQAFGHVLLRNSVFRAWSDFEEKKAHRCSFLKIGGRSTTDCVVQCSPHQVPWMLAFKQHHGDGVAAFGAVARTKVGDVG